MVRKKQQNFKKHQRKKGLNILKGEFLCHLFFWWAVFSHADVC